MSCPSTSTPVLEKKYSNYNNSHILSSRFRRKGMINGVFNNLPFLLLNILILGALGAEEDCPWYQDSRVSSTIKAHCQCARNPSTNNQLSIQCQEVEASQLVSSLTINRGKLDPLELLYLNASKVTDSNGQVPVRIFRDVKMVSLSTILLLLDYKFLQTELKVCISLFLRKRANARLSLIRMKCMMHTF